MALRQLCNFVADRREGIQEHLTVILIVFGVDTQSVIQFPQNAIVVNNVTEILSFAGAVHARNGL